MPDAYLAGRRRGGGEAHVGGGGGRPRLLVLDTEIVDRAGDGSLWMAKAWERCLLPPDGAAYDWDAFRFVRSPPPPLRHTHRTAPHIRRIVKTRSHPAQSPDPVPLSASGPFDLGQMPSEGLPRPQNCLPQPAAWAVQGRPPPLLPPVPCVTLQGIAKRSAHFFCASASFPAASTGICSYCPKRPPPPPLGQSAPPGPSLIARCARQAVGGPGVAVHSGGECCAAIATCTPRRGIQ